MSRFFMYGTALEGLEQMMMLVPNFTPRGSGVVILNVLIMSEVMWSVEVVHNTNLVQKNAFVPKKN